MFIWIYCQKNTGFALMDSAIVFPFKVKILLNGVNQGS